MQDELTSVTSVFFCHGINSAALELLEKPELQGFELRLTSDPVNSYIPLSLGFLGLSMQAG